MIFLDSFQKIRLQLAALRNALDYPLRQAVRLRRSGLVFRNEPKDDLFTALPLNERQAAEATAGRLQVDYHLDRLYASSTVDNYRENLFYLELLEHAVQSARLEFPASVEVVDIGPSHWFYVQALHALLTWWQAPQGRDVHLEAYEIDPYRVYLDLRSRWDHAQAHIRNLPGVQYWPRPFTCQPGRYDLVIELFPFVFERDHLEWGLPRAVFHPPELLAAAWNSLKPSGALVIVNQGLEEHQAQLALLHHMGVEPVVAYQHSSRLFHYRLPRYVLVSRHA